MLDKSLSCRAILPSDIPLLVPVIEAFFKESSLPGKFNPAFWCYSVNQLLLSGSAQFFVLPNLQGCIGGYIYNDHATGDRVVDEWIWYVLPGHRRNGVAFELLTLFEDWAKNSGAKRIMIGHLTHLRGEAMGKMYRRRGYRTVEHRHLKVLSQ